MNDSTECDKSYQGSWDSFKSSFSIGDILLCYRCNITQARPSGRRNLCTSSTTWLTCDILLVCGICDEYVTVMTGMGGSSELVDIFKSAGGVWTRIAKIDT